MPSSTSREAEQQSVNRFPSCVSMDIDSDESLISSEKPLLERLVTWRITPPSNKASQINLYLTIRFGEELIALPGGSVIFGLRAGELKLKLYNGELPLKSVRLSAPFKVAVEKEIQKEQNLEEQDGINVSISGGLTAAIKKGEKIAAKFSYDSYQIHSTGSATEPIWFFEIKTDEPVLRGLLTQEQLGTVHLKAKPCRVEATFEVSSKKYIRLTGAQGLWPADIDRNKLAILERKIALLLLEKKLKPYLSCLELIYD
jgi:hypothetical protein